VDVGVKQIGTSEIGDFGTPEQAVPEKGLPGTDWESCITMNGNWGYNRADRNFKSVERLIGLLVETASKGGNLLLNVGPTAEGLIPEESVTRLAGMGQWMQTHASAIRGTTGTPFDHTPYRVTRKGDTLHLFFWEWPAERDALVPAFDATAKRALDGPARRARAAHGRSRHRRAATGEAVGRNLLCGDRGRIAG
jgi:alpha-L-fucosidase